MDNPIKKWRRDKKSRDKKSRDSVKIISETGEEIGEIRFGFNTQKKRD